MSEIRVPDLGENIDEAAVLRVLVAEGERVETDQPILELESDKASFELPSPEAGVVRKILVHEGDTVKVGQPAIELDGGAPAGEEKTAEAAPAKETPAKEKAAEAAPTKEKPAEKKVAEAAPTKEKPAEKKAAEAAPKEKPAEEKAAEAAPKTRAEPAKAEAQPAEARKLERVEPAVARPEPGVPEHEGREVPRAATELVPAGPATRRLARELEVDLADVSRVVDAKRITREHVLAYVRERAAPRERGEAYGRERAAPPARGDERLPLDRVRRISAERLAEAWPLVPLVTHHELADITEIEAARRAVRAEEPELKLTVTAIAVKACTIALRAHPRLNSSLDLERGELVLHHAHHIGIAVDTEHGLVVPVVRDAADKSVRALAREIAELSDRARARTLTPEELSGATFTITNLGGISGTGFTPLVVPPQVAILGLSRARSAQLLEAGAPAERLWLPLSLSYDHRAVDGAEAARFVATLVRLLQSPMKLLLEC